MTKLFALVIAAGGSPNFDDDLSRNADGSYTWHCQLLNGTNETIKVADLRREAQKYLVADFIDAQIDEEGNVELTIASTYDVDNEEQVPNPLEVSRMQRLYG